MKHVTPLRYDVAFKKAFSIPEIFSAFVSDVLGKPFRVDRVETEKRFPNQVGPVTPRFDLYAEDSTQRMIVDIQHRRYPDHYARFLYYHCVALIEQGITATDYRTPFQVVTIVVLTSGDHHQKDMLTIDFDPKDHDGQGIQELFHRVIYLCPKYANDRTPPAVRQWMDAIEDTLDEKVEEATYSNTIQQVFTIIEQHRMTPDERAKVKDENAEYALLLETQKQAEEERIARKAAQKQAEEAQKREEAAQEKIAQLLAQLQALQDSNEKREM